MPQYTYTNLQDQVFDPLVYPNIATTATIRNYFNRALRMLCTKVDFRSMKRKAATSPVVFDDVYDYSCPADLKALAIIDLAPQVNRARNSNLTLTTPEEFDRRKSFDKLLIAIKDNDFIRKLRAALSVDSKMLTVSTLDSLTAGGGTWMAVGDATNLRADGDNFVKGAGSILWDIGAGGTTTAGIQNTGLNTFDFSDYVNYNRSIFHWEWIVSTANITNFILRVGSSSSNYYQITVTTTNEGLAFQPGWNLLRFDFSSKTTVGTPVLTAGTYCSIYMTKSSGKVSETGYRSDDITMEGGSIYDVYYYSKYAWQTNAGTYIENSTTGTDLLNMDTEEFDLAVLACKIEAARERKDYDLLPEWKEELKNEIKAYQMRYPSEAKLLQTVYYEGASMTNNTNFNVE